MPRVFLMILCLLFFSPKSIQAQVVRLHGQVRASSNLEGIHVINKTSSYYTVTNQKGEFQIKATLKDTLVFSSIQYKLLSIIVDEDAITSRRVEVDLVELVNELDEVFIAPVLTGNLEDDVNRSDAKPAINFYDVGIPGYKGKPKTNNERALYEATSGVGLIPLNPILNAISGRTKKLKQRVKLGRRDELMYSIKARFSESLFQESPLRKDQEMDFFYFCAEDPEFETRCGTEYDLLILKYLNDKLSEYLLHQTKTD